MAEMLADCAGYSMQVDESPTRFYNCEGEPTFTFYLESTSINEFIKTLLEIEREEGERLGTLRTQSVLRKALGIE